MTTIRAALLSAVACLALAGCNTTAPDMGGVLSSLGTPKLGVRDCQEIARDATGVSARGQADGENAADAARELAGLREEGEAAGCNAASPAASEALTAVPVPTAPVEVSAELPPPVDAPPVASVAPVLAPAPAPVVDISISSPAARSAWDSEPLPVGVAGLNPASDAGRQAAQRQAEAAPQPATAPSRRASTDAKASAQPTKAGPAARKPAADAPARPPREQEKPTG